MTSVHDLLDIPELRLRVRTGERLLGRGISRIYGTELPDPSRYLSADELVLSGLLWWRGPADAEPFVAALAKAGSAALAASAADTGEIPPELIAACERHAIPLLEVPADLSFAVITERVVLALAGASAGRIRLRTAAAGDSSLTALLGSAGAELGAPCWVLSATGRVVAGGEDGTAHGGTPTTADTEVAAGAGGRARTSAADEEVAAAGREATAGRGEPRTTPGDRAATTGAGAAPATDDTPATSGREAPASTRREHAAPAGAHGPSAGADAASHEMPAAPAELARAFVAGGCRARQVGPYSLLPVARGAAVPWALVVRGDRTRWTPGVAAIADELVSLVELDRSSTEQVRRVADRVAAPLVRLAAGDSLSDSEFATGLAAAGLPGETTVRVVLARGETGTPALGVAVLSELLAGYPGRTLVGEAADDACALILGDEWPADWTASAARALSTMESLLPGRLLIGVGGPARVAELRGAAEQARHALAVAEHRPERVAVVSGEQLRPHQLLIAASTAELRRALRARVLGPLLDYDAAQHADLVRTVEVFLDCSGSPTVAAKALHVHVNTLRYRLARASELLGTDLSVFRNQVDVYLALRMSP